MKQQRPRSAPGERIVGAATPACRRDDYKCNGMSTTLASSTSRAANRGPGQGRARIGHELAGGQLGRITYGEDCSHDVRRREGQAQEPRHGGPG